MQRLYALFILILKLCFVEAQSAAYHPLLQPGRVWVTATQYAYEQCAMYFPPWSDCTVREQLFMEGDTVIEGIHYQKCMRQGFSLTSGWMFPFLLSSPAYYAALREDIVERKVYIFDELTHTEVLMYDFTLEAGASAEFYRAGGGILPVVVNNVSELPDGRRKWTVNQYQEMVEGVGMGEGLFPQYLCFEVCSYLACLKEGGIAYYDEQNWPFSQINTPFCDYVTATETPSRQEGMSVYPNPGRGIFFTKGIEDGDGVTLTDVSGRRFETVVRSGTVDMSEYPSGMYYLKNGARICRVIVLPE